MLASQSVKVHPAGRLPEVKASKPTLKMSAAEARGRRAIDEKAASVARAKPNRRPGWRGQEGGIRLKAEKSAKNLSRLMICPIIGGRRRFCGI